MAISKQMVIGWLSVFIGILAIPAFLAKVPETWLPYLLAAGGIATLIIRWLSGGIGANPLTVVGIAELVAALFEYPDFVTIIPLAWTPYISMAGGIATLIARWFAGQSQTDPAKASGLLLKVS